LVTTKLLIKRRDAQTA